MVALAMEARGIPAQANHDACMWAPGDRVTPCACECHRAPKELEEAF